MTISLFHLHLNRNHATQLTTRASSVGGSLTGITRLAPVFADVPESFRRTPVENSGSTLAQGRLLTMPVQLDIAASRTATAQRAAGAIDDDTRWITVITARPHHDRD